MLWNICIAPLPDTSTQVWSVLNGTTQSYLSITRSIPSRAGPHLEHLHPQFSTAFTHCLLIATHFTIPERMVDCVKLEIAASGSWTRAAGVRGECVITRPPAIKYTHYSWQFKCICEALIAKEYQKEKHNSWKSASLNYIKYWATTQLVNKHIYKCAQFL